MKNTALPTGARPFVGSLLAVCIVLLCTLLAYDGHLADQDDQRHTAAVAAGSVPTVHIGVLMNVDHVADTVASVIHALPDKRFVSWMTNSRRTSFQFSNVDELTSIESVLGYANAYNTKIVVARFGGAWELFTEVPMAGYFYQFRMYPSVQTVVSLGLPSVPMLDAPEGSRTLFDHAMFAEKVRIARSAMERTNA